MPLHDELAELKRQILRRYVSIHAFCRRHPELGRSPVYALLAGKYSGNLYKYIAQLWQIVNQQQETQWRK